ncbi:MAG TPA: response regulator [Syntrophorhabdales bacterium]|nr:response regulator [Syntrophorhabdales bacterium]
MRETAKVLITDDDPELLRLTATILERAGYEVLEASTGKECLEATQAHHPDIILLDVILPDISGIEVCKQIKADEALRDIFVILVSGVQVSSEYQAEGLDVGADGYIIKPISNKELVARVHSLVRIKRAEDALRLKEKEQQKLISELQEALAEIKTLKGFIPICASCKKIRDDQGYWNQLEAYISKHTDAVLSHGLCPECAEKYEEELKDLTKKPH